MKLSELRGNTVKLPIQIGDKTLTVEYRSDAYTFGIAQEFEARLKATTSDEERGRVAISGVLDMIEGWDLTEEDGTTPIPVSPEIFAKVPAAAILAIFNELAA